MVTTRSAKGKPGRRKSYALSSRPQQRKAVRQACSKEALEAALAEARQPNHRPLNAIAKSHGVPSTTLHRHVTGHTTRTRIGRQPYLSLEIEDQIAGMIQLWHETGDYVVQKTQLAAFVFVIAHKLQPDSSMVKSWEVKGVSAKWIQGFLKRHPNISAVVVNDLHKSRPAGYKQFYTNMVAEINAQLSEEHSKNNLQAQLDMVL